MNIRYLIVIVTIAAIAVTAIGIGYAYQATTEISNNSVNATYLVIDPQAGGQDETSRWSGNLADYNLYFNTISEEGTGGATKVTYTLNTTDTQTAMYYNTTGKKVTSTNAGSDTPVYLIGTQQINLTPATGGSLPDAIKFTLSEKGSMSGIGEGYTIYYSIGSASKTNNNAAAQLGTAISEVSVGNGTLYVDVYVAITTDYSTGNTSQPSANVLNAVTFEYKAEVV